MAKKMLQKITWPRAVSGFTGVVFKSDRLGGNLNASVAEMGPANLPTKNPG
jgi:hypothetical protein